MSGDRFHQSAEWQAIRAAYLATLSEYNCMQCGKPDLAGTDLHVDHIDPGHQGNGEYVWNNDHSNLRTLCSRCNGKKKDNRNVGRSRIDWKNLAW